MYKYDSVNTKEGGNVFAKTDFATARFQFAKFAKNLRKPASGASLPFVTKTATTTLLQYYCRGTRKMHSFSSPPPAFSPLLSVVEERGTLRRVLVVLVSSSSIWAERGGRNAQNG